MSVTMWLAGAMLLAVPLPAAPSPCDEPTHDCCCGPGDCKCHTLPATGLSGSPCSDVDPPALPVTAERLQAPCPSDSISPLATDKPAAPTLPANRLLVEYRVRSGPNVAPYILGGALLI
jgi:hypothetical protein